MSNRKVINIKNLTKTYKLYKEPKDRLKEALSPFKKKYHKDFNALENISFEVYKGETVGIIGKNGSGKSTLLKVITGVLSPTSGTVNVTGNISAILELGSGFNPEMTGLENIYLSMAINGIIGDDDIEERVQDIIDFAELGDFIHQPIKIYSSGMKARLSFSVAINIKPEILIVDEVLSVGDVRFKQKSMRKMKELIEGDCTVLFVSHDSGAIKNFCSRVIWIDNGKLKDQGDPEKVVNKYAAFMAYGLETETKEAEINIMDKVEDDNIIWSDVSQCDSFGAMGARITHTSIKNLSTQAQVSILRGGERISFYIKIKTNEEILYPGIGLILKDRLGNIIFNINNYIYNFKIDKLERNNDYILNIVFTFPHIKNGIYVFSVALADGTQMDHIQHHWVHDTNEIKIYNHGEEYQRDSILVLDRNDIEINIKGSK